MRHPSPADVLEPLREGNRRFVGNARRNRDLPREVRDAAGGNPDFGGRVARRNVHRTILDRTERSSTLAGPVETDRLGIADAMHDVSSGRIELIETSWESSE